MKNTLISFFFLMLTTYMTMTASTLVEILPITTRIVVLHFDDGYIKHSTLGENMFSETRVIDSLLVSKSSILSNYTIISSDDAKYSVALNPTAIARKSKGMDFLREVSNPPKCVMEHWIAITLPFDLISGKTYTIKTTQVNTQATSNTFIFDEKTIRSEAVHVNLVGFAPTMNKFAYISYWAGSSGAVDFAAYLNAPFNVIDATSNTIVFSGTIKFRKSKTNQETSWTGETLNGNFIGSDVYECDFSSFQNVGTYKISVPNIGCSYPFSIGNDAMQEPFFWTMKALYENRSGIALTAPYTTFPRPAPHNPSVTPNFGNRMFYSSARSVDGVTDGDAAYKSTIESKKKGAISTWGWYQDAGDWDAYYRHSHIPAYLMIVYETNPTFFKTYTLNIPESTNSLPDVLDETRWLLAFYKRSKDAIKAKGYGTGGVAGARVFGDFWGEDTPNGILKGSWQDTNRDWYLLGEDPWMTYKYAGLAAQFAWILLQNNLTDPDAINWKQEAIDAYTWAKSNTLTGDEAKELEGEKLKYPRMFAAAALYRLTQTVTYQTQFMADAANETDYNFGSQDMMWSLHNFLLATNTDVTLATRLQNLLNSRCDDYLITTPSKRAMRWGGVFSMPIVIGQATTPRLYEGLTGYLTNKIKGNKTKSDSYLKGIAQTADYFLGGNAMNMSWVSGVGENTPSGIFHLDWFSNSNYFKSGKNGDRKEINLKKGIVPYGIWRSTQNWGYGWWNFSMSQASAFPKINTGAASTTWPAHEMFFNERITPVPAEFTVDQNIGLSTMVYGFLLGAANEPVVGSSAPIQFKGKIMLEGLVTNAATPTMNTTLLTKNLLPKKQPFNVAPWNYNGTEQVNTFSSDIVDWVLLLARDNAGIVKERKAVLLKSNGILVDENGFEEITFAPSPTTPLYVSIHHRSHLPVMSKNTITNNVLMDFTLNDTNVRGVGQLKKINNFYALIAADYDGNSLINNLDFNLWKINSATVNKYLPQDADGNGLINNLDYNFWAKNKSKVGINEIKTY